jgi:hypothetical protein
MVVLPPEVTTAYVLLVGCRRNKRIRKGFATVWLAYVWVMWKMRNDWVVNNVARTVERVVEDIQRTSWQWFLSYEAKGSSLLYEWVWNPRDCMLR